jgi:hypothetical protein
VEAVQLGSEGVLDLGGTGGAGQRELVLDDL